MTKPYQVLIADDEPIIREGIRDAVDWETLGMEVAAEAEDGEEALELALSMPINIMLVDMNMPFLDGIGLMKRMKEEQPACRFVIITGHDEFAYAQEAIRLGVKDYILKPVNAEHLIQVLVNVRDELNDQYIQENYLKKASEQIEKNIPLLRERFCLEWVHGLLDEEEANEQLEFLGLPPCRPSWVGIARWPEMTSPQPLMKESDRQLYLFAMVNIISELFHSAPCVVFRDHTGWISICFWGEADSGIAAKAEQLIQKYLKLVVNVHLEPVLVGGDGAVAAAYETCREGVFKEAQLSPLVRRARQLIQEQYAVRELTLESLAQALQVSPVYLSRTLKKELGTSFITLMTQTRIQKAIQLLNATELSIFDIAERVGYDSQHYFSTAFKKVMGVSPNRYRKGATILEEQMRE